MNKKISLLCILYAHLALCVGVVYGEQSPRAALEEINVKDAVREHALINFSYLNEDLVNILYSLSEHSKQTLLLPQGTNAINVKVTYDAGRQISYEEAWNLVVSLLDVAGYATIKKDDTYQISKMNKEITREGLPVFIGTDLLSAPTNDEQIVYVHFFTNMKASTEGNSEVQEILKLLFPEGAKFVVNMDKNAVIMAARARDIEIAISILSELDKTGFKEKIDKLKLEHTSARFVADLFNEHILHHEDANKTRLDTRKRPENSYFGSYARIVAYERLNMLIMIGQEQAIERIKDFIREYIDVEPDHGKSILHTYRLEYLVAETFAPVLQKIVEGAVPQSTGQAKTEGKRPAGPEKFFDEVIIIADKPTKAEELHYYGGNNLVIACRNDDWQVIHDLIESLDIPQPQVFLEILVADLTIDDSRVLGSIMRNPTSIPLPHGVDFQAAMISPGIILDTVTNAAGNTVNTSLQADLLNLSNATTPPLAPVLENMSNGSTAISISDSSGKTWSVLQLLKLFNTTKIISHPHIIATNNKEGLIKIGQYRLVDGDVTGSIGSNTVQKQEPLNADLTVKITPRISADNVVNLEISVDIEDFVPGDSNAIITRKLKTNANVESESILTLGGLVTTTVSQGYSKTPGLGDIPVVGWLFKTRTNDTLQNSLTIFICPTIIRPQERAMTGSYTQDYINIAHMYAEESILFDSIRDPITRLYFGTVDDFQNVVNEFVVEDNFIKQEAIMPEPPVKKVQQQKSQIMNEQADKDEAPEKTEPKKTQQSSAKKPTPSKTLITQDSITRDLEKELTQKVAQSENPFKKAAPTA